MFAQNVLLINIWEF